MIEAKISWLFVVADSRATQPRLTVGLVTQGALNFRVEIREAHGNAYYSLHRLSPCHYLPTFSVKRKSGYEAQMCPAHKCGSVYGAVERAVGLTVRDGEKGNSAHGDLLREHLEDWHDALGSDVLTASLQASELVNVLYGLSVKPRPIGLPILPDGAGSLDDIIANVCRGRTMPKAKLQTQ